MYYDCWLKPQIPLTAGSKATDSDILVVIVCSVVVQASELQNHSFKSTIEAKKTKGDLLAIEYILTVSHKIKPFWNNMLYHHDTE